MFRLRPADTFLILTLCGSRTSSSHAFGRSVVCRQSIFRRRDSSAWGSIAQISLTLRLPPIRGRASGRRGFMTRRPPRDFSGLPGRTTPRERSPCSAIDSRNLRSKLKSIASLCARTSISTRLTSELAEHIGIEQLFGFVVPRGHTVLVFSPRPLKSPRPGTQVPRDRSA